MKKILLTLLLMFTTTVVFPQSAKLDTNVARRLDGTSNGYFTGSNVTGSWNFQAFGAPTVAPVAGTPSAGGSCTAGTHSYKVTFATVAGGESTPSVKSNVITCVTTTGQTVGLSGIPAGPPGTTARKLYRTVAGDAGSWLLLTTISDNTTTTYSDTIADGSLGTVAPSSDTTAVANIQTGGTTRLTVDSVGHIASVGGTAPTITANCGTSPSIVAGSTDNAGQITVGTGGTATSCTITFGVAFISTPKCVVNHEGAVLALKAVTSTATLVITAATALTASGIIDYICIQ